MAEMCRVHRARHFRWHAHQLVSQLIPVGFWWSVKTNLNAIQKTLGRGERQ
jgi:hypothetical protein